MKSTAFGKGGNTSRSTTAAYSFITDCPPNSMNCLRTSWTAPKGINVSKTVQSFLDSYPQAGQNGVDKGGWSIAEGNLLWQGKVRVEFQSGLGFFAKLANGNKPFIDDLWIQISGSKVELKSASRIGQSDLGVNRKRLMFLVNKAKAQGFLTQDLKY